MVQFSMVTLLLQRSGWKPRVDEAVRGEKGAGYVNTPPKTNP